MSKFFKNKTPWKLTNKSKGERSMDQVQSEYMQAAVELGNIEYQIETLQVQKKTCISKMAELSLESTMIKKPEQKEPSDGVKETSGSTGPDSGIGEPTHGITAG